MYISEETFSELQSFIRNTAYLFEVAANRIWERNDVERDRHADALLEIGVSQMADIGRILEAIEVKAVADPPLDLAA